MTQIKLRRDTSANFTSKNPVLGVGEPAYETDTKKLKIGDGTTAYTQLDYFSSGGGGSTNITATLPLKIVDGVISLEVDGQTIQVVDGKLHANLDELGNEVNTLAGDVASVQADLLNKQDKSTAVTTDTAQNISGQKEFNKTILLLSNDNLIRAQQSAAYRNGAGLSMGANSTSTDGGVFAPQWKIYNTTGGVDRTETIITTGNQSKLNSSNFNTANKLVKLNSDGKLPAIDGSNLTNLPSGSAPTNMVTTDTEQTISGRKTFSSRTFLNNDLQFNSGAGITDYIGTVLLYYNQDTLSFGSTNRALQLVGKSVIDKDDNKFLTSGNVTAYVTEEFVSGTEGYRVWSNGRCEQWGYKSGTADETITFLKAFKDTNYNITMATEAPSVYFSGGYQDKTATSMGITFTGGSGGSATGVSWRVDGYIA